MNVLWMNIPAAAAIFAAMTGIPLWLVFKHPDTGPAQTGQPRLTLAACPAAPAGQTKDRREDTVAAA